MDPKSKKRERAANFNVAEIQVLIKLVEKNKHIIENKKTDAVSNKDKEAAWVKITNNFNASGISSTTRSWKTLKLKYEGLKKTTKKKSSQKRQELYRTGGGPSNAPEFNDIEEKVLSICSNINGLSSRYDCDNIETPSDHTHNQVIVTDDAFCSITNGEEASIPDINEDYIIQKAPSTNTSLSHVNDEPIIIAISKDESICSDMKEMDQNSKHDIKQSFTPDDKEVAMEVIKDLDQSAVNIDEISQTQKEKKWERWHPNALKSSITKVLREKVTKGSVTTKLDQLSTARLELVYLQKEIAKKEHQFVEEEHKLKMEHLKNEERRKAEIHCLLTNNIKKS